MKRIMTFCIAMLFIGSAAGQILECVDAKGRKEYAQICPPDTVKETRLMKNGAGASAATASPVASPTLAERNAEFRKRALERQEAEAKSEKADADAKEAERSCIDARAQLRVLQDGGRVGRIDPATGERGYLEDDDRPAEIARAQKAVDGWCKK